MSKKLKQTYFQEDWLTDKEFSEWVPRAENDKEARCMQKKCFTKKAISNSVTWVLQFSEVT